MAEFVLTILTPDGAFFEGPAEHAVFRTTEGDVGILAGHADYIAALISGPMKVTRQGSFRRGAVHGGVLKVHDNKVTVLASACEWADEIDVERARRAEQRAREQMAVYTSGKEFDLAQAKLKRALTRLRVTGA